MMHYGRSASGWAIGIILLLSTVSTAWSYPFQFTDDRGQSITIKQSPRRVVSLVPSLTEILFRIGAGDRVVGVTYHSTYPSEAATRPVIGGFFNPDSQRVRSLEPDVIFYSKFQKDIAEKLGEGSWQLINIETDSISDSFAAIRQLGDIFDCRATAEEIIAGNKSQLDLIARKTDRIPSDRRLRVMRLMGRDKVMTPGDDSFQNELIRAAGGIPPQLGKAGNVVSMSREEFVEFNPQVIYGCGGDREVAAALFEGEGYRDVDAVKAGRIYYFPCDLTCRVATSTGYFVTWWSARIYQDAYARPENQVLPNQMIGNQVLSLDLPYIDQARIVRSRIADFLHKTLIVDFNTPLTVVSTLEGQRSEITTIGNHYSPPPYWGIGHQLGLSTIQSMIYEVIDKSPDRATFLFTGANMDNLALEKATFKDLTVHALVTAGVRSNAVRMSRDLGNFYEPGTINIILLPNAALSPRAMTRAIISATEAKTAALADMDIRSSYLGRQYQATGTGTDNIIVAAGTGTPITNTGGHSKMGELVALAVYQGVKSAVFKQNGITAARNIFQRLRDRKITPHGLVNKAACDCVPDTSAAGAELEAVLLDTRYADFVEAALAMSDIYEAGLITDLSAFETWCRTMADEIAGEPLETYRQLVNDAAMPQVQRMALDAVMNGVYGRLR
jgi:ABC-type Fe3+-hydroxamate transport system substrate-binding protein/adenosylcobinamide amidohydrolase